MATPLSSYTAGRDNNFNLIRFIAASMVLVTHSFALVTGSPESEPLRDTLGMTLGSIAVDIFFVTSGFLITSSFVSRNNLLAFAWARMLRIYPALIVALLISTFIIGLLFTNNPKLDYLTNIQTYKYFIRNSLLFFGIEHTLPGVFADAPYKNAVNGSLWTLPYEVKMYTLLALFLCFLTFAGKHLKLISNSRGIFFIAFASVVVHMAINFAPQLELFNEKFIRLFSMFFFGAAVYLWAGKIKLSHKLFTLGAIALAIATLDKSAFFIVYCVSLPYLLFYIAYVPGGPVRQFNRLGDFSYGMYIYAFPIQQMIATLHPETSITKMIAYSFILTLLCSVLSWNLIEKKALKLKNAYLLIEKYFKKASSPADTPEQSDNPQAPG